MKVAVIYPEVYDLARFREKRKEFPPFGVLYLAAVMDEHGIDVQIFKINPEYTALDLRSFDAIAYSIPSSATYGVVKQSHSTSLFADNSLIMVGGVHPNFYPEETLLDIKPHVVGVGEGEETILELLQEIKTRRFSKIKGVCYLDGSVIVKTEPRNIISDIDTLPLPARHLFERDDIVMNDRLSNTDLRMAHVMFSRGCPFPCRFCAAAQTKMQYRSGQSARKELIHLIEKYHVQGFAIVDDNFIVNKRRVRDICECIKDLDLGWSALSRVDTVDQNLLDTMKAAGCVEIKYGMESGSHRILKAMRKNITQSQIRDTIKLTHQVGIKVKLFLIHGFPGEDFESTHETGKLLEELSEHIERVSLFRFVPLPGTYVFDHPNEFNLHGTNHNASWDGNWSKYHIHHNNYHWWGTSDEYRIVNESFHELEAFVNSRWPSKHKA